MILCYYWYCLLLYSVVRMVSIKAFIWNLFQSNRRSVNMARWIHTRPRWTTSVSTYLKRSGPCFNIKTAFPGYGDYHIKDKTVARPSCLVHPCVRDKRRVSEIDLSKPRHETAFWWRHNRPVTSQLTDPITLPNYPLELIGIYVHINTQNKESLTQRCRRSTNVQRCLIFLYISIWFES